eukprot:758354-Hanusia_phi.AAC.1
MQSSRAQERLKHSPFDVMEGNHKRLQESIVEECREMVKKYNELDIFWFNDDVNYVQAVEEATMLKKMALNKIYIWLDSTKGDYVCEELAKESITVLYRKAISELQLKARSETVEPSERQKAAEKACRMQGIWRDQGESPILTAAKKGQADVIALLKIAGFDVNATSADGETALHICATQGNNYCLQALLKENANVNKKDRKGETCAHCASREGQTEAL